MIALTLGACGNSTVKETPSETTTVATTVTTATTTTVAPKPDNKELYKTVFEDIRTLITTGVEGSTQLKVPMQYWAAHSLVKNKETLQYLFYDINNDGVDELFIGHRVSKDNKPFAVIGYYLDGKSPKILHQSFVGEAGGARSAFSIFKGGLLYTVEYSSGTGNGEAKVYRLEKNGDALTPIKSIAFKEMKFQLSDLGLHKEDMIDLSSMDWQPFK